MDDRLSKALFRLEYASGPSSLAEPGVSSVRINSNSRADNPSPPTYSAACASRLGKNTLVGVCSTSVRAIGLASTSLALCVANAATAFSFRQVLSPSRAKPSNAGSASNLANSSIHTTTRRPSSRARTRSNRYSVIGVRSVG